MLRRVEVNSGIHPPLDEELAAEIEILVLFRGTKPGGEAAGLEDDNGAVVHIKGRLRSVLNRPAVEGLAIEQRGEAGLGLGLHEEGSCRSSP